MASEPPLLFVLDLAGTFAFALNGALTAVRAVRLDIVGVVTLGMITALGGGTVRDVLLDALPPATFVDLRYLAVAAIGALIAFGLSFRLERLAMPITVLDAIGLSVFAVIGAHKGFELGFGVVQSVIVGAITGVGGGTIRDVVIGRIPTVLRSELYAIPALLGAAGFAAAHGVGYGGVGAALGAAAVCFVVRMLGVRFDLHAPRPPGRRRHGGSDDLAG
ncbi:trimeric intracellular cation channel family protein [Rhodococcus sp. IEGM 1379]|uniref:trimeric intracellular cation channel family protein n=1 Tax=Rhodococcus sp. IEGM 1379 TaxID=3047086 RepID=UPI0024B6BA63|nr:trimeric intracellular cation channel family protein [Rhodococcus sp. IEGM 1379]MDI9915635.1 trimeric intracellular cation channel family protein [Rhodococcus sp. IEGM 1379]